MTKTCKEMLWMKRLIKELGLKQNEYAMNCDSQNTLDLSKNVTCHYRTKQIDVRYFWICKAVNTQEMLLKKIHINKNPANILIKVVTHNKHQSCTKIVRLNSNGVMNK